jgi:hypothetical protein
MVYIANLAAFDSNKTTKTQQLQQMLQERQESQRLRIAIAWSVND